MQWLLLTNPRSKLSVIRWLWRNPPRVNVCDYKSRYQFALITGGAHLCFAIFHALFGGFFSLWNIAVNIYPVIIQLYMGRRCWILKKKRLVFIPSQ